MLVHYVWWTAALMLHTSGKHNGHVCIYLTSMLSQCFCVCCCMRLRHTFLQAFPIICLMTECNVIALTGAELKEVHGGSHLTC